MRMLKIAASKEVGLHDVIASISAEDISDTVIVPINTSRCIQSHNISRVK